MTVVVVVVVVIVKSELNLLYFRSNENTQDLAFWPQYQLLPSSIDNFMYVQIDWKLQNE